MGNVLKTGFLLAVLTCLVVLIGQALGGQQGMLIALVLALGMNFISYWFSDKMVLAMYRAQPVDEAAAPELFGMVRTLATRAAIPMPKVYIIPTDTPNAFATGRNPEHAAVAVTEGITRILSREELEGVLAHELAHIKNRDTLVMTITATLAGAITYLAQMAQFAAIFGGRRDSDEEGHGGACSAHSSSPSWLPSRPCWCSWPSPAPASSTPTRRAPRSPAAPGGSPPRWRSSTWRPRWSRCTPLPRPRICSS